MIIPGRDPKGRGYLCMDEEVSGAGKGRSALAERGCGVSRAGCSP